MSQQQVEIYSNSNLDHVENVSNIDLISQSSMNLYIFTINDEEKELRLKRFLKVKTYKLSDFKIGIILG